jgi:hypothetical protein
MDSVHGLEHDVSETVCFHIRFDFLRDSDYKERRLLGCYAVWLL